MCAGVLSNADSMNPFIKFCSWISPHRYACELYVRRVSIMIEDDLRDILLSKLGFTYGDSLCLIVLASEFIAFTALAFLVINLKNRKR